MLSQLDHDKQSFMVSQWGVQRISGTAEPVYINLRIILVLKYFSPYTTKFSNCMAYICFKKTDNLVNRQRQIKVNLNFSR